MKPGDIDYRELHSIKDVSRTQTNFIVAFTSATAVRAEAAREAIKPSDHFSPLAVNAAAGKGDVADKTYWRLVELKE